MLLTILVPRKQPYCCQGLMDPAPLYFKGAARSAF